MLRRCLARLGAAATRPGARSLGQLQGSLVEAPLPLGGPTHPSRGLHRLAAGTGHTPTCGCGCRGSPVTVQQRQRAPGTALRGRPFATEAKAASEEGGRAGGEPSQAAASPEAGDGGDGDGEAEGPSVDALLQQLGERESQLEDSVKQLGELKDKVLRAHADMANLRDRTSRQSENDKRFAVQSFAKDLLDVADNLDRAMAALPRDVAAAAESGTAPGEGAPMQAVVLHQLAVGVSLTAKALAKALARHGCVRFEPKPGDALDPHTMAALFQVPPTEAAKEKGSVAVVTKAGYKLNDRVIRPADVGVVL